jgi:hypothetical protein
VSSPEPAKQALQRCERFIAAIITTVSSNKTSSNNSGLLASFFGIRPIGSIC